MPETSTSNSTGASHRAAIVGMASIAIALIGWQGAVALWFAGETTPSAPSTTLHFVEIDRTAVPPPPRYVGEGPQLLVLGNSHTYTLPSPTAGRPMQIGGASILPDELARQIGGAAAERNGTYLLAYPNFLPYEMLTRTLQLRTLGYRPRVVVLGLTWRNVARDSRLREQVFACFRDPHFADDFFQALDGISSADAAPIRNAVAGEVRRTIRDAEAERLKSHADRLDERLFAAAQSCIPAMRYAVELRTSLYKSIFGFAQTTWQGRESSKYSYDLIEADLEFNLHCLRAMLARYVLDGSQIVIYYAPERNDLPPLLDPERQEKFIQSFDAWCDDQGITTLDARRVVPNDFWGFDMNVPDRSHFTEPGHRILAEYLVRRAKPLQRLTQGDATP